jgi:hypothetical protein
MRFLYSLYFVVGAFSVFAQMDSLRIEGRKLHPNRIITLCLNSAQNRANLSLSLDYMVSTSSPIGEKKAFKALNYMGCEVRNVGLAIHSFDKHLLFHLTDTNITYLSFGEVISTYRFRIGSVFLENNWKVPKNGILQFYTTAYLSVGAAFKREQYIEYMHPLGVFFDGSVLNSYDGFHPFPIMGERNSTFMDLGFGSFFGFNYLFSLKKHAVSFGLRCNLVQINGQILLNAKTKTDLFEAFQSSLMKNRIEGGFSYGFTLGWMF